MDEDTTLIPLGEDQRGFDVVLRGYDRAQVDAAVDRLERALGAAERRIAELVAERDRLRAEAAPPSFEALGARVTQILTLAEEEAAELRRSAEESLAGERERAERAVADRLAAAAREAADVRAAAAAQAEQLLATAREQTRALEQQQAAIHAELERLHARLAAAVAPPTAPMPAPPTAETGP